MKKDWARRSAEVIVADGRGVGGYFQLEEEIRDEKRIAAALRRAYRKGLRDQSRPAPSPLAAGNRPVPAA